MARIKILDLPRDIKISQEEKKKIFGGQAMSQMAMSQMSESFRGMSQMPEIGQDTNIFQQMIDKDKD